LVYDFDGTVYARRFWKELGQNVANQDAVVHQMTINDITNGFGGRARVEALKRHFEALSRYRPRLGVVLHTFHYLRVLKMLFKAIGIDLNQRKWFDVVLSNESVIVRSQLDVHSSPYSKNTVIESLCKEYRVEKDNVLYIDDDPKVGLEVKSCVTMVVAKQTNRKGMSKEEMKQIIKEVHRQMSEQKPRERVVSGYIPQRKECVSCGNVEDVETMKSLDAEGNSFVCSQCYQQTVDAMKQRGN